MENTVIDKDGKCNVKNRLEKRMWHILDICTEFEIVMRCVATDYYLQQNAFAL